MENVRPACDVPVAQLSGLCGNLLYIDSCRDVEDLRCMTDRNLGNTTITQHIWVVVARLMFFNDVSQSVRHDILQHKVQQ